MLFEIHAHSSKHSKCSLVEPVTLVKKARDKGMQGIVLTEHKYLWSAADIKELKTKAEVEDGFVILAGQEAETDIGHVLVYGAEESFSAPLTAAEIRKKYPDAAIIWAHPFRKGKVPSRDELKNPLLDGIEIFNVNHSAKENYLALSLWHEHKFTAVSGSDTHAEKTVAIFPTEFYHPVRDIRSLAEEIKRSRCKPFVKEIPRSGSNVTVTEITMGTKGSDEFRTRLITKHIKDDHKWGAAKRSLAIREAVLNNGFSEGRYRVAKTIDYDEGNHIIIEEGQRGRNLYELLSFINPRVGIEYFRLAAEWLARLHNLGPALKGFEGPHKKEKDRLLSYLRTFTDTGNPRAKEAEGLLAFIADTGDQMSGDASGYLLSHGDYHPKNIMIGQDRAHDISTLFISVIDFDNSLYMPPAFDAGYFLSQFKYQFRSQPEALKEYQEKIFLDTYNKARVEEDPDMLRKVLFFRLRANFSIAAFLIKVGKGEGPDMDGVMEDSLSLRAMLG